MGHTIQFNNTQYISKIVRNKEIEYKLFLKIKIYLTTGRIFVFAPLVGLKCTKKQLLKVIID